MLTLSHSRRWKAQDRKTEVLARGVAAVGGAGLGGYTISMQQKGGGGPPPGTAGGTGVSGRYGVGTLEERMRWAQIADTLTNRSVYAVSCNVDT